MTTYRLGMVLAAQLLVCHVAEAAAQKVYRCGPDGRIYSQTPCKDGYEAATANPAAAKPAASAAPSASASASNRKPETKKPQPTQP